MNQTTHDEETTHEHDSRGRTLTAQVGFYMWRGGLIFCALYGAYEGIQWVVRLILEFGLPLQVAVAVALLLTGFLLLVSSLIVERAIDARAERGLLDQ